MIPVKPRHDSDCTASCLAAILELPIEEMPDFWAKSTDGISQHEAVRRWLSARGWHWSYTKRQPIQLAALRQWGRPPGRSWPPRGYWMAQMATVDGLRDDQPTHLVVMKDRRLAFDPSGQPKRLHEAHWWLIADYVLVPLDPAKR